MNNEEKEWLRDRVNRWADSDLRHYEGSESVCHDVQQDRYALIALIDRQPSEEEATEAWNVLQQGLSRCESVNEKACARCSKFKGCQEGEETIRKALSIKEDKCQK